MDSITLALLAAVLLLETFSHLCLKAAAERARTSAAISHTRAMLRQPWFWAGIAAFVFLFLAWLAFISRVPLAKGIMLGAITIVGVMVGGRICFNERITPPRAIAVGLISAGVALVGWGG
jgi:drug/metabolite transporter (DMT)-like permease